MTQTKAPKGSRKVERELNERQRAEAAAIRRLFLVKLSALNKIAMFVGLISSRSGVKLTQEDGDKLLEEFGPKYALAAISVLTNPDADAAQHAAAGMLLQCFVPDWRDKISPEIVGRVVTRNDKEVREWRNQVFQRDGNKCAECGSEDSLHAHHIVRWADCPSLRIIVDNGITLCKSCHGEVHASA